MTKASQNLSMWWKQIYHKRYYLLLVSISILIVLPAFTPERNEGFIWTLSRTFLLLACINILRHLKRGLLVTILLGVLVAASDWFTVDDKQYDLPTMASLLSFGIFVGLISFEVFNQVLRAKTVDMHIIVGAFCGFLLIGLITMVCCTFFHLRDPESFTNVASGPAGIDDLLYFSYITILTIGYGDISPLTEETRRIALFFGLIGQFYLAVIMAVLVGKFIGQPASNHADSA